MMPTDRPAPFSSFAPLTPRVQRPELARARATLADAIRSLCDAPPAGESEACPLEAYAAVDDYVVALREAGLRAEQVVVDVKQLLDECGARDPRRPNTLVVAERVIAWSINAYYA